MTNLYITCPPTLQRWFHEQFSWSFFSRFPFSVVEEIEHSNLIEGFVQSLKLELMLANAYPSQLWKDWQMTYHGRTQWELEELLSNGIVMFWRAGFRCWSELITVRKILTSSCRWGCDFECECETLWDCNCCKQAHVNPPLWIDREIASEISRQCWKHFFMGFSCRLTILEVAVDSS